MSRKILHVIPMLAVLLVAACGSERDGSRRITAEALMRETEVLAADDMEGRGTGQPGSEKAARYIAERFEDIGLAPVNGSYYQTVELVGMTKNPEASSLNLRNRRGTLAYESDVTLTYWSSAQEPVVDIANAPLVFVGYGTEAPEHDWDDFKGEDVAGKVLLFLNDDPQVSEDGEELFGGEARTYYGRWTYKFEQAMKHGAAGAVIIHTTESASYPFSVVQRNGQRESLALNIAGSGYQVELLAWIDSTTSEAIAVSMGTDLAGLFEMAQRRDFRPRDTGYRVNAHIETNIRVVDTKNVYGMVEGGDPELQDQVIVFVGHYDHLGVNETVEGDDKIFNGAWDNAAGTAAIINIAEAFAAQQPAPRRSLLFLACAAEEGGINGSKWFVARPPFGRSRLVAAFNIDMPQIFGVTSDLAVLGAESSTLGDALREVAGQTMVSMPDGSEEVLVLSGDPNPRAGSFYRSDHVSFAKAGIPALAMRVSGNYVTPLSFDSDEYRAARYHQVDDEITEEWNLAGLVRDVRVFYTTALLVANADEMPRWVEGNEFESEWKELHRVSQ